VSLSQRDGYLLPYSRISRLLNEAEWTPFQTHYFSENLVASGIEPGPLDLVPGTLTTTRPQRRSTFFYITYINSVRTSQETQYISVLYPGALTTRPQRRSTFFYITYINSVRTSQETIHLRSVARNSDH
jgi:hypothetical protein